MQQVDSFLGSKYQKFQVAKVADAFAFQRSTATIAYWNAVAKFVDGIMVADAFFNARNIRIASRFQRLVFESCNRYDRGFSGV